MISIKLSLREIELLNFSYGLMNISKNYTIKDNLVEISNNELKNLDIMFNCVLDTFLREGLCDNDEPNELGIELEELNQKINHEYVKLNKRKKFG